MVTQQEIARSLGLSQAAVSAALNGRKKDVSQETYDRIWAYSQKIGYRRKGMRLDNPASSGKANAIGLILRGGLHPGKHYAYFADIQAGLSEYLDQRGIFPTFLGSEQTLAGDQLRRIEGVNGVVVFGEVEPGFIQRLREITPGIVVIYASYPGQCHSIQSNEEQAAELLVEHLLLLGHRRIGWVGGQIDRQRFRQCKRAFLAALEWRGQKIAADHIVEFSDVTLREGREAAQHFLNLPGAGRPTALVCYSSGMARAAVNHFLQCGVRVPEDICVAAFGRTHWCLDDHPTITSAGADLRQMGLHAGELVFNLANSPQKNTCDILIPSTLDICESTGAAPENAVTN